MSFKSPYRMFPWRRVNIDTALGNIPFPHFDFNLGALTFVAGMAKRAGGTFAAAPIVQGQWDGTGTPDALSLLRGNLIFDDFYQRLDMTQCTISFSITPEWDGDDGLNHQIFDPRTTNTPLIYKNSGSNLSFNWVSGPAMNVNVAAWTAGTTYHIVCSWDTKKTIDGTNYARLSINNSHTFGWTTKPTAGAPATPMYIGSSYDVASSVNAIIEGLRIDRRVWYEATSGTGEPYYFDANGYIDEIAAAYAAGAGADPALVEASWDGCMCLPTDSAVGALVTGTGEAWSHPHASALLNNTWLEDAFGPNQQDVVTFNGTSTAIDCGSAAALDDIPAGGGDLTVSGWFKDDSGDTEPRTIIAKGGVDTGWYIFLGSGSTLDFRVRLVTTDLAGQSAVTVRDGKWHHFAAYYDDTAKTARVAIDGKWGDVSAAGAGAYTSDAALDLYIGRLSTGAFWFHSGSLGWMALYSDDHHVAGTDFIPPRTKPGAGGTLVESWGLDDGTGATAAATVTTPGNDGTIANGTWTEKFEFAGTPLELTSLEFDGAATDANFGSGINLDDLPDGGAITAECWFRLDDNSTNRVLISKHSAGAGWFVGIATNKRVSVYIFYDTTDISSLVVYAGLEIGRWHHFAMTYDEGGDRQARVWIDGILASTTAASAGAYTSDAGDDLVIGDLTGQGGWTNWDGAIGWTRVSNNIRYTDTFLPPTRVNPPGNDANAQLLINMDEGAGATAADTSGNAYDGTITMGDGQWWNTFAQEYDAPGERSFAWGYSIGSDGASDGVEQHLAVTAGDDHVLRIPVRYEDVTAQAQILVYDETGAAAVSTFNGPPLTGVHDGLANAAAMTDTGNVFPASLIDGEIYNITDGSSGTITAVGGTNQDTITATLAGGTEDDWDIGDVYMIVPPANWVWCEPFCVEMPAGCTEASVQLLNAAGDGVLHWQQAEVQDNLVTDPSIEDNNASNPFITTGWANVLLDPGDTAFEAAIVHSGVGAVKWNVGAIWGEYMEYQITLADNKFFSYGLSHRGDGTDALRLITTDAALQYSLANNTHTPDIDAVWLSSNDVRRATAADPTLIINPSDGVPSGTRFHDDVFVVECDDVSLTVTPASEANSLEGTGIRVDGRDSATQTQNASGVPLNVILQATEGWIRWRWTPRHDAAELDSFGEAAGSSWIATLWFDGTHYIELRITAANTIRLGFNDGGGVHTVNWNCAGQVVAATPYLMELKYTPARIDLLQVGVVRATVITPIDFGVGIMTTAYWGSTVGGVNQGDAVFTSP